MASKRALNHPAIRPVDAILVKRTPPQFQVHFGCQNQMLRGVHAHPWLCCVNIIIGG